MKVRFFILSTLLALLFLACNSENSFYRRISVEDLWRIPLINPYELRTIQGIDTNYVSEWQLDLISSPKKPGSIFTFVLVYKLNVMDSIIYGFGPFREGKNKFFIIDARNQNEILYDNINEWQTELVKSKINSDSLIPVWDLFYQFKKSRELPWRK